MMIYRDLFHLGIPLSEKVIRTAAVYLVVAVLLRLAGRRDLAQLSTFDLVVVLLLSNVVQNAIIGNDNSLLGGVAGAVVLLVLNAVVVRAVAASRVLQRIFEGPPVVLVDNGRYRERALRRLGLRPVQLEAALRAQDAEDVTQVQQATLQAGGSLIVKLADPFQNATRADLRALEDKIDRLSELVRATRP